MIDEVNEFAKERGWTLAKKPYGSEPMGFLPCDALGPDVFCVLADDVLIGHSQLGYEEALEMAVFRSERYLRNQLETQTKRNAKLMRRMHDYRAALYWVMNVVHNVSRADGGPLRSGEAEEAFENAKRALDGDA